MIEWNRPGQAYTGRYHLATMGTAPSRVLVLEQPNGVEVQLPLAPKLEESFKEIQPGTLVRVVYQGNVRTRDGVVRQAVERPTCGGICRVCRARILLARIERQARRAQPKRKKR